MIYTDLDSFSHLISNIPISGDLNPPLYYLLIYLIRTIFPDSIITYRIFSALTAVLGLISIYILFKNHFKVKNKFIIILLISVSWFYTFYLFIELRSYGLSFLLFSILMIFWFNILKADHDRKIDYVGLGLTILSLFYTHYFSVVYVFPLLLLLIYKKRNAEILLTAFVIFIISLPLLYIIKNQLDVFHGATWQEILSLYQIISLPFTFWGKAFFLVLILLHITSYHKVRTIYTKIIFDKNLIYFLSIVFVVPIFIFILSRFSFLVFVERYFILTFIGLAILIGIIVDGLMTESKYKNIFFIIFISLGIYYNVKFYNLNKEHNENIEYYSEFNNSELPIICESPHVFYPLWYYSDKNYNLLLDWESSNIKGNVKNSVFDYYGNIKIKNTYKLKGILIWEEFVKLNDKFYIIDEKGRMLFENRISDSSNYVISDVGNQIKLVEKKNE